LSMVLRLLPKS